VSPLKRLGATAVVAASCTGCLWGPPMINRTAPLPGGIVTVTKSAQSVTENPIGKKKGEDCAIGFWAAILFIIQPSAAFGDASGAAAAKKMKADKVSVVDQDQLSVLGLFARHCTSAIEAEGGTAEPAAAPSAQPATAPSAQPATGTSAAPAPSVAPSAAPAAKTL
jgi:hypothetical protein